MKILTTLSLLFLCLQGQSQELGNDYYFIHSDLQDKVWTTSSAPGQMELAITLKDYDGSDSQKFRFAKNINGKYFIQTFNGYYVLPDGKSENAELIVKEEMSIYNSVWDLSTNGSFDKKKEEVNVRFKAYGHLLQSYTENRISTVRLAKRSNSPGFMFKLAKVKKPVLMQTIISPGIITAKPVRLKPQKVKLEIQFSNLHVDIHNRDCTRMQGEIELVIRDKRTGKIQKDFILNFQGNKKCNYDFRDDQLAARNAGQGKYDNNASGGYWSHNMVIEVDKTSLENGDIHFWFEPYILGGHKGGGMFDTYGCGIQYNKVQSFRLNPDELDFGIPGQVVEFPGNKHHTISMEATIYIIPE